MTDPSESQRCLNCGTPLTGPFCSQCGQTARDINVPLRKFGSEFLSEALALDSRLWHTLKPLFLKPGLVAKEYNEGKRARFVPPIRLYLFTSFVLFLAMVLAPGTASVSGFDDGHPADSAGVVATGEDSAAVANDPPQAETTTNDGSGSRFSNRLEDALSDPDQFADDVLRRLSQVMFFLVPLFALLLKMVYRKRLFVQDMVYALYLHVFAFSITIVITVPAAVGLERVSNVLGLLVIWIPVYLFLGLRRVYGESRLKTTAKWGFVSLSYLLLLLAGMGVAFGLAILI